MSRGGNETKTAMTELIGELDRTRKEFAKSALQVTQLDTQLQTTRDELMRRDQRILQLENEMQQKEERHRQIINTVEEEYKSKELSWAHRSKGLELEVQRLTSENTAMTQLERENRQLRDTILENQSVMERLQAINDDLRNKAKEDAKDQTAFLEVEFKKRLAESEKKFRAEAYRALSEEAKLALQGNDHLQTVLQRQNDSIEAVLLRCKTLEQAHSKIQEEQEANVQSIQSHVAEIHRLKKQLADAKSKGVMMDEALKQRRVERASLELLFVEYETTRKQLAQMKEKARRAVREADRWKSRAVQLTHELDDEQREAAEAKLANMQTQSDNIETHLERRRQREMRRAKVAEANADGANALRQAEGTGGSDDGGAFSDGAAWDGVSDEEEENAGVRNSLRQRNVDPMEILAMWNVNFDSWRPPTEEEEEGQASNISPSKEPKDNAKYSTEAISDVPENVFGRSAPVGTGPSPPSGAVPIPNVGGSYSGSMRQTVQERSSYLDQKLSVLSQPKSTAYPPGARHYVKGGRKPLELQRQPMPPLQELSTVSKGEFKIAKRGTTNSADANRFLVP